MVDVCAAVGLRSDLTSGVAVRPWEATDAEVLLDAWTDPEVARWNPVPPEPTLELARSWIRSTQGQNEASVGIDVVVTVEGTVIGEVGLQVDPAQSIGEVGFWLAGSQRGSGLATELLRVAEALCQEVELRGLVALVDPENTASIGLLTAKGWPEIPTRSQRRGFAYRNPLIT